MKAASQLGQSVIFALFLAITSIGVILLMSMAIG